MRPGPVRAMRVLILHPHYWPEIAATAQLLTDLAEDLVREGHHVHVVAGQPSYREHTAQLPPHEVHRGVTITRVPTYRPRERQGARRVAHYVSYFASSLVPALAGDADVMLVLSPPPLLCGVTGAFTHRVSGVPFVYVVEDVYPELGKELGALRSGLGYRGLARLARGIHREADAIVAISDDIGARLVAHGVDPGRLEVVHNWADTDAIVPASRDTTLRRELGLGDRFVVLYAGNVSRTLGLGALVEASRRVAHLPITVLVCGEGDARPALERAARDVPHVRFVPSQPRARLGELLASADVGLVTTRRAERGLRFPSKLFGVMAAARPVLASTDEPELAAIVRDADAGMVVPAEDAEALADAMTRLFTTSLEARTAMGARGRAIAEARFSRRVATGRYRALLETVASRR